jgi:drug/metabolite transporter (DMT)-like permease
MNILAIGLVILSALFHATRNLFTKESKDKQVFLWWYSVFGMLFFSPVFLYFLLKAEPNGVNFYFWSILSGFCHFLYWIFHTKSYEKGDLSHVYPIMRSSPALVLIFAVIFLDERVAAAGVIGILLVAIGVYAINLKRVSPDEFMAPLRSIWTDRSTQYAFLTLISVALYSIIDKQAVDMIHPVVFAFVHLFVGMLLFTPYILLTKKKGLIRSVWKANKATILANGFLGVYGYALILIAFTIERVSYTVGLRQLSIVFAVIMGGRLLNEKHRRIRFTAAIIIFIGAFLITTAK